eukprot:757588-Hanusia_phi.AAC.9
MSAGRGKNSNNDEVPKFGNIRDWVGNLSNTSPSKNTPTKRRYTGEDLDDPIEIIDDPTDPTYMTPASYFNNPKGRVRGLESVYKETDKKTDTERFQEVKGILKASPSSATQAAEKHKYFCVIIESIFSEANVGNENRFIFNLLLTPNDCNIVPLVKIRYEMFMNQLIVSFEAFELWHNEVKNWIRTTNNIHDAMHNRFLKDTLNSLLLSQNMYITDFVEKYALVVLLFHFMFENPYMADQFTQLRNKYSQFVQKMQKYSNDSTALVDNLLKNCKEKYPHFTFSNFDDVRKSILSVKIANNSVLVEDLELYHSLCPVPC